ncbi:MAG: YbaB/EbfC family nucleoid-associated protein [Bacilli bacterium]|nr:YbaB/EbfC family nucleoid-associated protein [Bacilli bacterium]MDD4282697.1 YbaB/EbfC family nucleoid-associated protein [Bacilli bacterium]MDD4718236.1 YbaB/EbfC family nucleoid-associated protein [Bacilli bacterium]
MNIQKMMKEAQKIQKEMMAEQTKIEETIYTSKSSIVNVEMKGNKELIKIKIMAEEIQKDEIEMIEDMILVAINDVIGQINKETETKLGKYTQGMPGIF